MPTTKDRITFNNKEYIYTESDNETILTSLEKTNGRRTTLLFTKNIEQSESVEKDVVDSIKSSIIRNYYKRQV